jgi:anti-sigma28 factor (negative regulator of flagellin synthesis)
MRVDDLNRAPQAQETQKTEAIGPKGKSGTSSSAVSGDQSSISSAASSLNPSAEKLEALRLQVEQGNYQVSAQAVAAGIINEHLGVKG